MVAREGVFQIILAPHTNSHDPSDFIINVITVYQLKNLFVDIVAKL